MKKIKAQEIKDVNILNQGPTWAYTIWTKDDRMFCERKFQTEDQARKACGDRILALSEQ